MNDRIQSIDAIKAFTIFLVVVGHILQKTILNFDDNYFFKFIYSFHMPLFIFISGFLSYRTSGLKQGYLRSKFLALLVPYFSWLFFGILLNLINGSFRTENIMSNLLYPDNGLWFLWVLFWIHVILYICYSISKKYTFVLLSVFYLLYFFSIIISKVDNIFCFKTFAFLFPFFFLGYISNMKLDFFKIAIKKWWVVLPFVFILPVFWHRTNEITIAYISFAPVLVIYLYKFIAGSIGVFVVYGLFFSINNFKKELLVVGQNTLPIYAMNFIFINWIGIFLTFIEKKLYYILSVIVLAVLVITCSLIVDFFLKKNKVLSMFFLGNSFK